MYTFAHVLMVSVLKVYSGDSEGVRTKKDFFCFEEKDICCSNTVEDLPNSMLDFLIYSFSCAHRNIGQNKQNYVGVKARACSFRREGTVNVFSSLAQHIRI